jgi:serine/threonine protein kinase
MTADEKKIYGNRCMKGYERIELLGRGGAALVWRARCLETAQEVAIKQFPKGSAQVSNLESGRSELKFNQQLFGPDGEPHPEIRDHPGVQYFCRLLNHREDSKDLWLIFEVCGKPLSKALWEVKGEFYKGERIYSVLHDPSTFQVLEANNNQGLKQLTTSLASALGLLSDLKIVHGDLKADNVLVEAGEEGFKSIKIIDMGSSFYFEDINADIALSTPEYLPPEILDFLENKITSLRVDM